MRSFFRWRTKLRSPARTVRTRLAVEALEERRQPATMVAPDLLSQFDSGASAFDNLTNSSRPTFAGTTSSSAGTGIALVIDNAIAAIFTVKGSGGSTFFLQPATPLAEGDHIASYYDASTQAFSGSLPFTIDATPPDAPPVPILLANDDPANVSLQIQGAAGTRLQLFVAGQDVLDLAATGDPQTVAIDTTSLSLDPQAPFAVWVVAEDTAGNQSPASASLSVTLDLEGPTPPTDLRLDASADTGTYDDDGLTNATALAFSGTALPGQTVTLYVDGSQGTSEVVDADGTFLLSAGPLDEGPHQVWVTAANSFGVAGPASNPIAVTIDTTLPVLTDVSLAPAALSPNDDSVQDSGTFSFTLSEAAYVAIYFLDDIDTYLGTIPLGLTDAGVQSFDLAVPEFTEGNYSIIVIASDMADNLGQWVEVPFSIDLTPPATPTFTLADGQDTGSSPSDFVTNVAAPQFVGVTDAGATIELHEGTVVLGSTTAAADGSWSIAANLADGDHVLTAVVRDQAGNAAVSHPLSVAIDTTAPVVDAGNDAAGTVGTPITLTAQVTDAHPGSEVWELVANGDQANAPSVNRPTLTFTPTQPGTYLFRHTATDAAGNVGQETVSVVVQEAPPALHVSWPAAVNLGAPLVVQLGFTAPGNAPLDHWTIVWGDGTTDTLPGTATSATHTYSAVGSFAPTVQGTQGSLVLTSSGTAVAVQLNQAPALTTATAIAANIAEDTTNSAGVTVAALVANLGVVDTPGSPAGLAVTAADTSHGTWQYSLDGATWTPLGAVDNSAARLLAADALTRLRFVPNLNWNGTVTLSAVAWDQSDGLANGSQTSVAAAGQTSYSSQAATISFTVTPVNDAPVLTVPPLLTAYRNTDKTIGSVLTIADIDSTRLRVTLIVDEGALVLPSSQGLNFATGSGTPTMTLDGPIDILNQRLAALIYRPTPGYIGSASLAITVNDLGSPSAGGAQVVTGILAITVVNRPPAVVANPIYSMSANTTLNAPAPGLLVAFVDADGDPLTIVQASPPSVGSVTILADGSFHYTPPLGFVGDATFAVQAFDGIDLSAPVWVTIHVASGGGLRR